MKTKIQLVLTMVIVTMCTININAQNAAKVSEVVETSFNNEFKDATFVNWSQVKFFQSVDKMTSWDNVFLARFEMQKENCIAYFASDGQILLSGREISLSIAPTIIKKETERRQSGSLKKYGFLEVSKVYEINTAGEIMYYVNLDGATTQLSVMVYGNGHSEILQKNRINARQEEKAVIASKKKK